ncbi:MAG TPA: hypothetical protein VFS21_14930 [Roseiflexaceae bacterium]|nr:hypothetical protein [Roseiflexaceae bacterium]
MHLSARLVLLALALMLGACSAQTGSVPTATESTGQTATETAVADTLTAVAASAPPTAAPTEPAATVAPTAPSAPTPTAAATGPTPGAEAGAAATCAALRAPLAQRLGVQVDLTETQVQDVVRGVVLDGCRLSTGGNGTQFGDFLSASRLIEALLREQGFRADPSYTADGPTGTGAGYRKEGLLALSLVEWQPGPGAFCPQDQPIAECEVPPDQQIYTIQLSLADDRLGPDDDAIKQAVHTYVMENTDVRGFLVVVDRVIGDKARARALPDDPAVVDPAFVFLQRTGDYWSVISLGTAFTEEFYATNNIPEELWIRR